MSALRRISLAVLLSFPPSCNNKARLEQFLVANDVEGEPKQVATVLTLIGGPTYGLLVNLLAPEEPAKQKLADIFATLDGHFAPKPLVIAERYRFNKRDQRPGEPLNDYVAELRRLARHCEFGSNLNEHLRDRLVCGLNNPATIRKLLAEANLDLKKAIHIAHATETAARDANELHKETPVPTHQLRAQSAKFKGRYQTHGHGSKPCYRCGGTDHRQEDCPHKNSTCDYCRKTGHIDAACRKKRADQPDSTAPSSRSTQTKPTSRHTPRSAARAHNLEAEDYSEDEFFIHHNEQDTEHKRTEIWIEPSINGRSLKMELDTGSALSIIPLRLYSAHFADLELSPSSVVLKTYTGERVRPTGALDVTVECNEQKVQAQLLVVDTCGPPLFGRDWLKLIRIDWPRVFRVEKVKREEEPPIKQAENLTPATKVKLEALLDKYADIFGEDRGKLRTGKGHLQLRDDAVPKFCKARPLPYALRSKVAEELSRLESDGIISPVSWSDWATPIVPIVKKDGSVRVCGDFKVTVNPQLNVEQYPLPRIDDVFASLAGGKRFSKIDLKQAYLQMEMDDESSALLTLNTHKGLFKLNRLAFGVASAPALWQRSMDQILQGIPYTQCILDDIIVTGEDDAEHLRNLETVFRRLSEAGLRVNRLKCNFFQEHVEYCGHGVSARGLHKTPAKIDAISDARCPVNVTELRSFLGLVNYYARFLPNLATTLHPLNELLQKGVEWRWTADCTTAFDTVKAQIASDLVLTHFDSALPVRVASDASPYGLGAVLSHVMPTGEERPIAFASRTLSVAEKNYSQIDKEALGIVWSIKKFHTYLYGRPFTLITDHQPLTAIFHPEKHLPAMTAARLQRYALFLAGYRYSIVYRKTTDHGNADGLSRLPLDNPGARTDNDADVEAFHVSQFDVLPVTADQVRQATRQDPTLAAVFNAVQSGDFSDCASHQSFISRRNELTTHQGCVLWGARVVVPTKLQAQVLRELHGTHCGVVRMKELARSYVWWPRIDADIESTVSACIRCQENRHQPAKAPLHPWEWPAQPWQRVHIDFAGEFLSKMWLIVVDAYSKWPEVLPMTSTTAGKTIERLREVFARHGLPQQLVSDNGPQFTSDEFTHFLKSNGIKHIRTAPYHPATNGLAERFVQTFKTAMKSGDETVSLNTRLQQFLLCYRSTPHATTKASPSELLYNRSLRTRLDLLRPSTRAVVQSRQLDQAGRNPLQPARALPVGASVMVRDYRSGYPSWIAARITDQQGLHYQVETYPGVCWRRHIDQIRPAAAPLPEPPQSADWSHSTEAPATTETSQAGGRTEAATVTEHQVMPAVTTQTRVAEPDVIEPARRYPLRVRKTPERLNL